MRVVDGKTERGKEREGKSASVEGGKLEPRGWRGPRVRSRYRLALNGPL